MSLGENEKLSFKTQTPYYFSFNTSVAHKDPDQSAKANVVPISRNLLWTLSHAETNVDAVPLLLEEY